MCFNYECSEDTGIEMCSMQQCYDYCREEEVCEALWIQDDKVMEKSCDEFWTWFDSNNMDCDDYSYCHAPVDCQPEYGFLDQCMHIFCWNECEGVETCEYEIAGQGQ